VAVPKANREDAETYTQQLVAMAKHPKLFPESFPACGISVPFLLSRQR